MDKGRMGEETPGAMLMGLAQVLRQSSLSSGLPSLMTKVEADSLPGPIATYLWGGGVEEQKWALQPFSSWHPF